MPLSIDEILSQSKERSKNSQSIIQKIESDNKRYYDWLYHVSKISVIFPFDHEREDIITNLNDYIKIHDQVLDVLKSTRKQVTKLNPVIKRYLFRFIVSNYTLINQNTKLQDCPSFHSVTIYNSDIYVSKERLEKWYKLLLGECCKQFIKDVKIEKDMVKEINQAIEDCCKTTKPSTIRFSRNSREDIWSRKTSGIVIVKSDLEDNT